MKLSFNKRYIVGDGDYTMYRRQARRIFFGKAVIFQCECWRWQKDENICEARMRDRAHTPISRPVKHYSSGAIRIGCTLLIPSQVRKIRAWVKGGKRR